MNQELIIQIFRESALANFIFTFGSELGVIMHHYTHGFDLLVYIAAFLGSGFGLLVSYGLFYGLAKVFQGKMESNYSYKPFSYYFDKYYLFLLAMLLFPVGSIMGAFFAGLTRLKPWKFLIALALYRLAFYIFVYNKYEWFLE